MLTCTITIVLVRFFSFHKKKPKDRKSRTKADAVASRSPLVSDGTRRRFTSTSSRINSGNVRKRSSYYSPEALVSKASPMVASSAEPYSTPTYYSSKSSYYSYQTPVHDQARTAAVAAAAATPQPSDWDGATQALQAQIAAMQASHAAELAVVKEQLARVSPTATPAASKSTLAIEKKRRSNPTPVLAVGEHAPRSSPSPSKSSGGSGDGGVTRDKFSSTNKKNPKPALAVGDKARVTSRQHAERLAAAGFSWQDDDDLDYNTAEPSSIVIEVEYADEVGNITEDVVAQVRDESAIRIEQLKAEAEASDNFPTLLNLPKPPPSRTLLGGALSSVSFRDRTLLSSYLC